MWEMHCGYTKSSGFSFSISSTREDLDVIFVFRVKVQIRRLLLSKTSARTSVVVVVPPHGVRSSCDRVLLT